MRTTSFCLAMLLATGACGAVELQALVKDQDGKPVLDAVVLATPSDGAALPRTKAKTEIIDQVDKEFVPHVKPILVGSLVQFPNKDNIRHHVYSFSAAKKFELPLYSGKAAAPVLFDKPGVVILGCNIHDWMLGYIYVSGTPYFAKTGSDGTTVIGELPAGEYTVRVWHPRMDGTEEKTSRRMMLGGSGPNRAEWQLTLKPQLRIPRVSAGHGSGYH